MNIPIPSQNARNPVDTLAIPTPVANETIDLARIVELVRRRLGTVFIVFLFGSAVSAAAGFVLMPNYTATALLAVQTPTYKDTRADDASIVDTHITMLKSDSFLTRVAMELAKDSRLGPTPMTLANLRRHTNVMQELKSSMISINETAKHSADAAIIANAIATSYVDSLMSETTTNRAASIMAAERQLEEINAKIEKASAHLADPATGEADRTKERANLSALQSIRGDLVIAFDLAQRQAAEQVRSEIASPTVRIAAHAETPQRPSSINPLLLVIPGALVSLIAGIALALALSRLDPRLRTASDVADEFDAPCLDIPADRMAAERAASSLTIALLSAFGDRQKRVIVTSSHDRDGKHQLVEELARSAARLRPSVLVVDLDASSIEPEKTICRVAGAQFDRMNCAAIFASDLASAPDLHLRNLIAQTSPPYEWIIVNAPPVLQVPAIRLLTDWMSLGVLAVRSGSTSKAQVRKALQLLTSNIAFGAPHAELARFVVALTPAHGIARAPSAMPTPLRPQPARESAAVPMFLGRLSRAFSPSKAFQGADPAVARLDASTAAGRRKD